MTPLPSGPSQGDETLCVSQFPSIQQNRPTVVHQLLWPAIVEMLTQQRRAVARKDQVALIAFASFGGDGTRKGVNVEFIDALVLDLDEGIPVNVLRSRLASIELVAYSTFSHRREHPKYRLVLPFLRSVERVEYAAIWAAMNRKIGGCADPQSKDAGHIFYLPSCPPERVGEAFEFRQAGRWLDPDEVLAEAAPPYDPTIAQPVPGWMNAPEVRALADRLDAGLLGGLLKDGPDMTQGFPDGQRTGALLERAGWLLGPGNKTEQEALAACLEWNTKNTPQLSEAKVESAVRSIAKSEASKRAQIGRALGQPPAARSAESEVNRHLRELAALPELDYERVRKSEAEKLGWRVAVLDRAVERLRPPPENGERGQGQPLRLPSRTPCADPVNGADVLTELVECIERYAVLPEGAAVAIALFIMHTYTFVAFHISPRLLITSPVRRCGKTTVLLLINLLASKPLLTSNITTAAIFRTVEAVRPTLIIDEADSFARENDELRGIINSGHAREGTVIRTVGEDFEPRQFSTWCPTVIAAIGRLPDTVEDRAVMVPMRRKLAAEKVARLRTDRPGEFETLAGKAARWGLDHEQALRDADPQTPAELNDRASDNWRPLLAIADLCGRGWPDKARHAALVLSGASDNDNASRGIQLLEDLRTLFGDTKHLASGELCMRLATLDGRPWGDHYRGRPITPNQLARLLQPFGIKSRTVRISDKETPKGYVREDFQDVFVRYLDNGAFEPPQPPHV